MRYTIGVLKKHWQDLISTANALELRMADMLDPHTESTVDQVRRYRMQAEEIGRAIALLSSANEPSSVPKTRTLYRGKCSRCGAPMQVLTDATPKPSEWKCSRHLGEL